MSPRGGRPCPLTQETVRARTQLLPQGDRDQADVERICRLCVRRAGGRQEHRRDQGTWGQETPHWTEPNVGWPWVSGHSPKPKNPVCFWLHTQDSSRVGFRFWSFADPTDVLVSGGGGRGDAVQQSWLLLTLSDHCPPEPEQRVRAPQVSTCPAGPMTREKAGAMPLVEKPGPLLLWLRNVLSLWLQPTFLSWKSQVFPYHGNVNFKIPRRYSVPD